MMGMTRAVSDAGFAPDLGPQDVHKALQQALVLEHGLFTHTHQALQGRHLGLAPR